MSRTPILDQLGAAERQWITFYHYLNQGEWWKPKVQPLIRVVDMDDRWRGNAVRWMERRAKFFETLYTFGETLTASIAADLASEAALDAMLDWQEERSADPVAWIRTTDLHKALIAAGILDIKVKAAVDDRS